MGDAASALVDLPFRVLVNLRAEVKVVASTDVAPPALPGVDHVWAHEQTTTGPNGEGLVRYLAGTVNENLFVLCSSGGPDTWAWPGVIRLAQAQTDRLHGSPLP